MLSLGLAALRTVFGELGLCKQVSPCAPEGVGRRDWGVSGMTTGFCPPLLGRLFSGDIRLEFMGLVWELSFGTAFPVLGHVTG